MAKEKNTTGAAQLSEQELYEQMLAGLSPEERAMLDKVTGQDNIKGGKKTPVVRVSYKDSDDADLNGKMVKKGNFVVGQKSHKAIKDGKEVDIIDEIGTDLGAELAATILAFGSQYSFFSEKKGQSCSSQVVRERGEIAVGSTMKLKCAGGECPRRKEGIDKNDKCTCQFVVFLRLPEGTQLPDGTDCPVAMMYVKGSSYMGFKDYLSGVGEFALKVNSLMCKTIFTTSKEQKGAVKYFDLHCKQGALDPIGFKENFALASEAMKELENFKEQNAQKALPAPEKSNAKSAEVAGAGGGSAARDVTPSNDDIAW